MYSILEYTIIGASIGYLSGYPITGALIGGGGRVLGAIGETGLEWIAQGYPLTDEPVREFIDDVITELKTESYPEKIANKIYEEIFKVYILK